MFMKILTASAFAIGLATSAMAQSNNNVDSGASQPAAGGAPATVGTDGQVLANPSVDPSTTTQSTTGAAGDMNSNAAANCANGPQGAQAGAAAGGKAMGTDTTTVNDSNCGK